MAFSFDPSLSSARDRVRLRIGDTKADGHFLEDETVNALLVSIPGETRCCIACLDAILASVARETDVSAGPVSEGRSAIFEQFRLLRDRLRAEIGASPFAGGLTVRARDLPDYSSRPAFYVGMDDISSPTGTQGGSP